MENKTPQQDPKKSPADNADKGSQTEQQRKDAAANDTSAQNDKDQAHKK
ncbi:MAG: hypothetical protein NVV60_10310 [Luteimonas sp.]|nr:hypothetical protein [Luteimonas sp.]